MDEILGSLGGYWYRVCPGPRHCFVGGLATFPVVGARRDPGVRRAGFIDSREDGRVRHRHRQVRQRTARAHGQYPMNQSVIVTQRVSRYHTNLAPRLPGCRTVTRRAAPCRRSTLSRTGASWRRGAATRTPSTGSRATCASAAPRGPSTRTWTSRYAGVRDLVQSSSVAKGEVRRGVKKAMVNDSVLVQGFGSGN